ncbi:hemagglutinin repeat-containing protein [Pantoea sp. JKS000250]|uniref:hemagglutinin repeat-containing protein n=1 Tax=Pantoea sp. JKS000250 TaxID=1938795 RepID=UPI003A5CF9FA
MSAQNSERTDSTNSSKGGSAGIGLTAGSGGYGISVSASVNAGKGRANGNGLTHTETTLTAGNGLSLNAGRDTTLTGAQVRGESVKVDTGRNLTLTSEQDSDRYDSKQQNASAGGSFTFGSMTGSASVNLSQDKMHSNWQSVAEQTGIFAGKGGFDVTAGEHTQLNGAVISSAAGADKNRLDTGTLGFSNIENHADYKTEHQSVGMSTGGSIGSQFEGNMANGLLAGLNGSGSASSVTKAAVSDGTIVIRDKANQTQDVSALSRDAEGANPGLDKIFDKDREQRRTETAQLLAEIGSQAGDIARTQGEIAATKAATEKMKNISPDQRKDAEAQWRKANPGHEPTTADITGQVYQTLYNRAMLDSGMGTGGAVQQGISAATAAIQGLAGGNVAQALSGAAAPYLAEQIHTLTEGNPQANLMAHAVVGAVVTQASGNSALGGAAGAATASAATSVIAKTLYGTDDYSKLDEAQKQTISTLSTLASGLAGGLAGDSGASAVAGAQAGKNTSENNDMFNLPSGLNSYGSAASTLGTSMEGAGATPEEINAAMSKNVKGDMPEGANITKVIVNGYKDGVLIAGAWYLGPAASIGKVVGGAVIAEIANGTYQWFDINSVKNQSLPENQQKTWDYWGSASAGITGALAPGRNIWQNAGIAAGGTLFTDGPDKGALTGTGAGWAIGSVVGVVAPPVLKPVLGPSSGFVSDVIGSVGGEFIGNKVKDKINKKDSNDVEQ